MLSVGVDVAVIRESGCEAALLGGVGGWEIMLSVGVK